MADILYGHRFFIQIRSSSQTQPHVWTDAEIAEWTLRETITYSVKNAP